jgi:hypothetical protein
MSFIILGAFKINENDARILTKIGPLLICDALHFQSHAIYTHHLRTLPGNGELGGIAKLIVAIEVSLQLMC